VSESGSHDWGFFYWAAVGVLLVFGFLTGFSIGLPFLLLGIVLFVRGLSHGPVWPADLGLLTGAGAVCMSFALLFAVTDTYSALVWAAVGVALTASSSYAFWLLRCRTRAV
jgi:hypothetical protein